ncbi:MAG TPA: TetR family transcriptional regulator [Acidimicrobiales bacterium]|jgi:AcrR family transcriptional regulator|nr:TetR family transcriptional regulator [Acidimicrobiales bacterium]
MGKAEKTRARILQAAENVVLRDGVAKLTLEAAAAEAGISKGGVLYHFPSRVALVEGMVRRMVDGFDQDLQAAGSEDPEPGAFSRAYLRATFHAAPGAAHDRENRLGAALIAAVAAEPSLLRPLQDAFDRWQSRLEDDGLDPPLATVVRLAADGLWLADLFGFAVPAAEDRRRVEVLLDCLTRGAR